MSETRKPIPEGEKENEEEKDRENETRKFIEGKEEKLIDVKEPSRHVGVSPDLRRTSYVYNDPYDVPSASLVQDGQDGRSYMSIEEVEWSPNSDFTLYHAKIEGSGPGLTSVLVKDGEEIGQASNISKLSVSKDGKRIAYRKEDRSKIVPVIDGEEGPVSGYYCSKVAFSSDSEKYGYSVSNRKEGSCIVRNGKKGKYYENAFCGAFSPDSKTLSYYAEENKKWRVVHMDEEGQEIEEEPVEGDIQNLSYSPDGKFLSQVRNFGGYSHSPDRRLKGFFIDNKQLGERYAGISEITWSQDSNKVCFVADIDKKNHFCVVEVGVEGKTYNDVRNAVYSPEGYLSYFARDDQNQYVVIDKEEYKLGPRSEVKPLRINIELDKHGYTDKVIVAMKRGSEIVKKEFSMVMTDAEKKAVKGWAYGDESDEGTESGIF